MTDLTDLPYGFSFRILPESHVNVNGLYLGGTIVLIPNGFGVIAPDENGKPYSLVADVHYPSGKPGPNGVTGVYVHAHTLEQLRERVLEKVEEWCAIHLT